MIAIEAYHEAFSAQKRMPELEPVILTDAGFSLLYARDVIHDRWPEAEPIIVEEAKLAYFYARDVIQGRWPEAEEIIAKSRWKYEYLKEFFFDEPAITKDEVGDFQWKRKKIPGYFAPASLFDNQTSLLDMMVKE